MTYPKTLRLFLAAGALSTLSVLGLGLAASPASPPPAKPAVAASAARSVHVTLRNGMTVPLARQSVQLSSGVWATNQLPPENIAAAGVGSWQNDSNGFATGAVGQATYHSSVGNLKVTWDNPFSG